MAGKKFTLLELYLDEIQIGPATLGDSTAAEQSLDADADADGADETSGCGCRGKKVGKLLAALLVVALVVLVAKKLLGGEVEDFEDLADFEDLDDLDE